jgi:hypothetical protein
LPPAISCEQWSRVAAAGRGGHGGLLKLRREGDRYRQAASNGWVDDMKDAAFNASVTAWQLVDWIYNDMTAEQRAAFKCTASETWPMRLGVGSKAGRATSQIQPLKAFSGETRHVPHGPTNYARQNPAQFE